MVTPFPITSLSDEFNKFAEVPSAGASIDSGLVQAGELSFDGQEMIRYSIGEHRWALFEEFDVAVDTLLAAELRKHPFLQRSAKLSFPSMASNAVFDVPEDIMLNDFLMRLKPFLFHQDMFFWKHMIFRIHQDVTAEPDFLPQFFQDVASRFDGTNFGKWMDDSAEGAAFYDRNDASRPKRLGIGSDAHMAYALSGGQSQLTYRDIKNWLYGKKYHHKFKEFSRYKEMLATTPERDFLFAARLHFIDLVDAAALLQRLVWAILQDRHCSDGHTTSPNASANR
ncbi:hypothetical protein XI08_25570 [Bradyrhizobium sp. CCBAU 11361]|nr:hypothetical protein [Bradyrhizobium sp. CCBAU 11361]